MSMPSVPIYKPCFDWNSPHPYDQFKLFKQKVEYLLINGPYKEYSEPAKVAIFINWLGDRSYELINTLDFPSDKSKENLKDVIEQFDNYFKPSQSTFQSWYELGSLYSGQFPNQSDFMNKLSDTAKDCDLSNSDEIVKFLFMVHNQNNRVQENLLKELHPDSSLPECLRIAKLTEGAAHVERLGKNFLANMDKVSQNVESVINRRQHSKSRNRSHHRSTSRNASSASKKDAKFFACFDAVKGFFPVPLDEGSKMLTAMLTPIGVYVYNVLAMGLSNSNDIFEQCLREILHNLTGVINMADDILVFGKSQEEFESNVLNFLNRCIETDLHLNPDKSSSSH